MDEIILTSCIILLLIGTGAAILERDPFKKLISLSIISAGIFPFIIDRGYLDVAAVTALIIPLSTIFILMVCQRRAAS